MKKILLALVLMMLPAVLVFAEERAPSTRKNTDQALIDMDSTVSRLNQLERRLNNMERDIKDQKDRTRYVERDVNDLKRRSNSSTY